MTNQSNIDKPRPSLISYETVGAFLSASRPEINDRIARLATTKDFQNEFAAGQALYQQYALAKNTDSRSIIRTVEEHHFPLYQAVDKPDPADVDTPNSSAIAENMRAQEAAAAKVVATQLGFVFQALSEGNIPAAITGVQRQREILDSAPIVQSVVDSLTSLLEKDIANLPNLSDSLTHIEFWDAEARDTDAPCLPLLDPLLHYVYLAKGIVLSQKSHNRSQFSSQQLASDIARGHIRGGEDNGFLSEHDLQVHLARTLHSLAPTPSDNELTTIDPLASDQLLAGKLVQSIIETPKIFDRLHPRVQTELQVVLEGFLLDAKVDQSQLTSKPAAEPVVATLASPPTPSEVHAPTVSVPPPTNLSPELINKKAAKIWQTVKKSQTKGWPLVGWFKKPLIAWTERDKIDDLRQNLEQSPGFKTNDPDTLAQVAALNLTLKRIDQYNRIPTTY